MFVIGDNEVPYSIAYPDELVIYPRGEPLAHILAVDGGKLITELVPAKRARAGARRPAGVTNGVSRVVVVHPRVPLEASLLCDP